MIIISPRLEEWIIGLAKQDNFNLEKEGLNIIPNKLHKEINTKLKRFSEVLSKLLTNSNPTLLHLQSLLKG